MKIKLTALLVATLSVAAKADDGVLIYGKIAGNYSSVNTYSTSSRSGQPLSSQRVDDNSSRLGFKGSERLGNGLTAIWQVENRSSNQYFWL